MKEKMMKILSLLLVLCMVLPFAACGDQGGEQKAPQASVDAGALYAALQKNVKFDTDMADMSESAEISYAGLPAGAKVTMYAGNGYYADELTWVALQNESDLDAAMKVVDRHIEQLRDHFVSYQQADVPKIDKAQIWNDSKNIILCITGDETAKKIIDSPQDYVDASVQDATSGSTDDVTDPPVQDETDSLTEPPTEAPTEPPKEAYPTITSQGSWRDCGNAMIVDNMAYEYYSYSQSDAESYAKLVSRVADQLQGETTVYSLVIPTAIGVVFPDNLKEQYAGYEDQGQRLEQIYGMMSDNVVAVNIFDKLMQHRDEYLYFRTDWHWSGIGAYYGYERFCEVKGINPYTMDQRTEHAYEGYLGPLYSQTCNKDAALAATPDTVYAYEPYYEDVSMVYTDTYGNEYSWPVLADGDTYNAGSKYLIFAAGDQPKAEFTNPNITDGSVAIVVKESFGNAMMSYFPDHYSTVYEIDYRYWKGDLVDFAREVGATDIIFANNIGMVRSSYLIGLMANIIP